MIFPSGQNGSPKGRTFEPTFSEPRVSAGCGIPPFNSRKVLGPDHLDTPGFDCDSPGWASFCGATLFLFGWLQREANRTPFWV